MDKLDEAGVAALVEETITGSLEKAYPGVEVVALDIGEVNITFPNGQRFRLEVLELTEESNV
jgi:hypothetical protein